MGSSQTAAASFFDAVIGVFDTVLSGFNNLKDLALETLFPPLELATSPKSTSKPSSAAELTTGRGTAGPQATTETAIAQTTKPFDLASFKNELLEELEGYISSRVDYDAAAPTTPVNTVILREQILLADTRPSITRQSDSDSGRLTSAINSLTDGGIFANATLTNASVSGTGSFSTLNWTNATGTSLSISGNATVDGSLTVGGETVTLGQLLSTRIPTLPHIFTTWPSGTSNASDATIYINPASAGADTNIFAAAVAGSVKFLVDAEGDIYGNNLVLTGSTSQGATTIAGNLTVQDHTFLGDATSDLITIRGGLLANASTTIQTLQFTTATGTSATTTNFFSTTASSTNLFSQSGNFGSLTANTANLTESGNLFYLDTRVNSYIHASTTIAKTYIANTFTGANIFDNITRSTTTAATTTSFFATTASSTNLFSSLLTVGTNALTVNSAGNVGIGTTPSFKLDVNGIVNATALYENGAPFVGSQWTTSGSNIYYTNGSVLIGTTTPGRILTVFNTAANAQQRISYDATRYAEFYVDASGDLQLTAIGKNLRAPDANLYLCDGGACPTTPVQGYPTFTSQGNLVAGGTVYATAFGPVTCPSGMIPVPASPADGTNGFCVDKYEAQSSSGNEVSVSGGSPWVSITQTSARAECIRAGKHLITEKEWLAIAHNVENVGFNWNGGVAGTNQMSDGHSDNVPASALATAADASACSGTGQSCDLSTWDSQRRVYKLSNDQYIWDFAGNVWEWVDQTVTNDYPIVNSALAGWQACSTSGDGVCGNTRTTNDQWYRGGFATIAGFIRGGLWSRGADAGAFTLYLNNAPSNTGASIGFRCSR